MNILDANSGHCNLKYAGLLGCMNSDTRAERHEAL